jgi:hypothetical protein
MCLSAWSKFSRKHSLPLAVLGILASFVFGMLMTHGFLSSTHSSEASRLLAVLIVGLFGFFRLLDYVLRTPLFPKWVSAFAFLAFLLFLLLEPMSPWLHLPIATLHQTGCLMLLAYLGFEAMALVGEWLWRLLPLAFKKQALEQFDRPVFTPIHQEYLLPFAIGCSLLKAALLVSFTFLALPNEVLFIQALTLILGSTTILLVSGGIKSWPKRGTIALSLMMTLVGSSPFMFLLTLIGIGLLGVTHRFLPMTRRIVIAGFILLLVAIGAHVIRASLGSVLDVGSLYPLVTIMGALVLGFLTGGLGMIQSYCASLNLGRLLLTHAGLWSFALLSASLHPGLLLDTLGLIAFWGGGHVFLQHRLESRKRLVWRMPIKEKIYFSAS